MSPHLFSHYLFCNHFFGSYSWVILLSNIIHFCYCFFFSRYTLYLQKRIGVFCFILFSFFFQIIYNFSTSSILRLKIRICKWSTSVFDISNNSQLNNISLQTSKFFSPAKNYTKEKKKKKDGTNNLSLCATADILQSIFGDRINHRQTKTDRWYRSVE